MMNVVPDIEAFRHLPEQSRAKYWAALIFSIVLHSLLLTTIYLLFFFSQREPAASGNLERDRHAEIVLVTNLPDQQQIFPARASQQPAESGHDGAATARRELSELLPTGTELSVVRIAELELPSDRNAAPLSQPSHRDLLSRGKLAGFTVRPSQLSAEDAALMEAEQARMKALIPSGDPVQVSLFGMGDTPGYAFVFLLDSSKSMGERDLHVLESAKAELLRVVQRLQPNHRFQVIAYTEKTTFVGPRRQMLKPSEKTLHQVRECMATISAAGGTSHANALSVAIGMRPDVIFVLTDAGRLIPSAGEVRQIIEAAKREKTTIYCIHFGNELEGNVAGFLAEISEQTGGAAKYVRASAISKNDPQAD